MEKRKTQGRKTANYIVGTVIIIFVIIGIVSTAFFITGKLKSKSGKSEKLSEYKSFISSVIMNDPATFDDVTVADQSQLIGIAIWEILRNNPDPDRYEYSEGDMLLPKAEVEESFIKLFGTDVSISHTTVDGGGIEFKYSDKKGCYVIPITGVTPIYTPKIIEADEKLNSVVLTVGYLAGEDWTQDRDGNMVEPEPAKYMKITLRKNSDKTYYVSAIQSTDAPQTVTAGE